MVLNEKNNANANLKNDEFIRENTIVIHPTDKWLYIGFASDSAPLAIPHCIAWPCNYQIDDKGFLIDDKTSPNARADISSINIRQQEMPPGLHCQSRSFQFYAKQAEKLLKSLDLPHQNSSSLTAHSEKEDIFSVSLSSQPPSAATTCEMTQSASLPLIGERALSEHYKSPHLLNWPLHRGRLNTRPPLAGWRSASACLSDMEHIWRHAIGRLVSRRKTLQLQSKNHDDATFTTTTNNNPDLQPHKQGEAEQQQQADELRNSQWNFILVLDDLFERSQVRHICALLFERLCFSRGILQLEHICVMYALMRSTAAAAATPPPLNSIASSSSAAAFGVTSASPPPPPPTAAIVASLHESHISVSCVLPEEGVSCAESRLRLQYGRSWLAKAQLELRNAMTQFTQPPHLTATIMFLEYPFLESFSKKKDDKEEEVWMEHRVILDQSQMNCSAQPDDPYDDVMLSLADLRSASSSTAALSLANQKRRRIQQTREMRDERDETNEKEGEDCSTIHLMSVYDAMFECATRAARSLHPTGGGGGGGDHHQTEQKQQQQQQQQQEKEKLEDDATPAATTEAAAAETAAAETEQARNSKKRKCAEDAGRDEEKEEEERRCALRDLRDKLLENCVIVGLPSGGVASSSSSTPPPLADWMRQMLVKRITQGRHQHQQSGKAMTQLHQRETQNDGDDGDDGKNSGENEVEQKCDVTAGVAGVGDAAVTPAVNIWLPGEAESARMAWQGAALINSTEACLDLWIRQREWNRFGCRVVRERVPFLW